MYGGNLGRAIRSARHGVEKSHLAGLNIPLAGSLTNLGSMLVPLGKTKEAKEQLESVLAVTGEMRLIRLSALDSLAQLAIDGDHEQ